MSGKVITCVILILCTNIANSQLTGFIKTGFNVGTINKVSYDFDTSIHYKKPLIRPIVGIGAQYSISENWLIRQELMFQIKGQGTIRPDVRSGFRTENPDIIRLMSFPLSIHRKVIPRLYVGAGFQPSRYLSGSDNYWAKEGWRGWIWGAKLNLQYFIKDSVELGFEYDHDFTLYYCPECDIRFYTYRFYGAYHFLSK